MINRRTVILGALALPITALPTAASAIGPGSLEDFINNVGDRVFFNFDKYELRPDALVELQKQLEWIKKYPKYILTIEGHTDERGTREYNLALGERRAEAVKQFFIANGIDRNKIQTVSYGKERPAVLGSNEVAWSQNRRAVTILS